MAPRKPLNDPCQISSGSALFGLPAPNGFLDEAFSHNLASAQNAMPGSSINNVTAANVQIRATANMGLILTLY
jgi:hypothetical protein